MKVNKKYITPIALYAVALGMILFTNPQTINPGLLAVPLLAFSLAFFLTMLQLARRWTSARHERLNGRTKFALITVAAFPALLLLLQSIGQLTLRDIITLIIILLLLSFYISRTNFTHRSKT